MGPSVGGIKDGCGHRRNPRHVRGTRGLHMQGAYHAFSSGVAHLNGGLCELEADSLQQVDVIAEHLRSARAPVLDDDEFLHTLVEAIIDQFPDTHNWATSLCSGKFIPCS